MTASTYTACGGVVFVREHHPITLERARVIEAVHRLNASHWLTNGEERTLAARLALAKVEMALADEMTSAIAEIEQPKLERAA
jgi:hypothetical protein